MTGLTNVKGVILAAGYGTRFLPATKALPKEMFPLIDKPVLAFIVEEFIKSGIYNIIIVISRRKESITHYFDRDPELENVFKVENALDKLSLIQPYKNVNLNFIYQKEMKGSGHALLQVMPWLEGSIALIAYPDDLHFGDVPLAKQLMKHYDETGHCVCAGMKVEGDVSRYGVFSFKEDGKTVNDLIEKPVPGTEPSRITSIGRYLFTPEYFQSLAMAYKKFQGNGEFYHVEGLKPLLYQGKVEVLMFDGRRVDIGEPLGYLEAILDYSAQNPKYRDILFQWAKQYLKDFKNVIN